jgi:formyltetrahydrofolate hydrolase
MTLRCRPRIARRAPAAHRPALPAHGGDVTPTTPAQHGVPLLFCPDTPGIVHAVSGVLVTADLDEGPIIEQEMIRVDHSLSPDELAARGREAERIALARAVRWHMQNRVAVVGNRTVVFP